MITVLSGEDRVRLPLRKTARRHRGVSRRLQIAPDAYTRLASLDGALAERYDYLARGGESDTARASGRGGTTRVTWDE